MSTNRRDFMKASAVTATGLSFGFVAASQPVLAQAIKTDFAGTKAGELSIPSSGIQMLAYVSRPEKAKGPLPIMIVCSEIFGAHEYIVAELKSPVFGLYGSADSGIPLESVHKMLQALAAARSKNLAAKASRFEIYLDAPHAFHDNYRETYRAGPAADGWVKCLDWFRRNGVA